MIRLIVLFLITMSSCVSPNSKTTESTSAPDTPNANLHTIDHLILAINDLDKGMQEFEAMTGVKPVFGGAHPFSFSHNALVSLGDGMYVEIMAPRPDATQVPDIFKTLTHLTPYGWALHSTDIHKSASWLQDQGFPTDSIRPGSRQKPDGQTLSWSTLVINETLSAYNPFFIQWGAGSAHPSLTSPGGCSLALVQWSLTKPERFKSLITALKIPGEVVTSANGEDRMRISLRTPRGMANF